MKWWLWGDAQSEVVGHEMVAVGRCTAEVVGHEMVAVGRCTAEVVGHEMVAVGRCTAEVVGHEMVAAGFLARCFSGPLPDVRCHITVHKMCCVRRQIKYFRERNVFNCNS